MISHEAALEAFAPERIGFRPFHEGWIKETAGGEVVVASLGWEHAHVPSYDLVDGRREAMDPLKLVVELQRQVWGMRPEDLVPANLMGLLIETGGSVLIAYDRAKGFNADGWLGFMIGCGSRTGPLVSHMLGVREDVRGTKDIGWSLKILQGYLALRTGHTEMVWTFDPMRGMNAYLNLEKLAATAPEFTVDKYGILRTGLYGDVPSDRLTAHWDLLSPAVADRIGGIATRSYHPPTLADVADVPEATPDNAIALREERPARIRYRIPGDIDRLAKDDPAAAIRWRQEVRVVFGALVTTKTGQLPEGEADGPVTIEVEKSKGRYLIDGFATGSNAAGERESYYLLDRLS